VFSFYLYRRHDIATEMTTMTSSGDAEDSLNVSDITVHNVAPANLYTGEFDEIQSDELDSSQVVIVFLITKLAFVFNFAR